ncbi:sodium:proton antiporter [Teredinibacter haidensis]|uniref:sodium:proton antiporter n=1 Tax=Teredinibacter haidensis TaxID=2731755 RepID=UPI000A9CFAB5|nr:sodium:proton antiporter [Teredinibacter haidensis]
MIFDHDELAQAIFFFENDGLPSKEMHYSEFEAILDGYVPAVEWAERTAKAVFLEIDSRFRIRTTIFFTIGFTPKGKVVDSWNIPLDQLVSNALRGPDLGAGPIRLVCASQCPIRYFQDALWDPDMRSSRNQLQMLTKAVKRNKLSIQFRDNPEEAPEPVHRGAGGLEKHTSHELRNEYAKEFRDQMAQILKDQRLRSATISKDNERSLTALKLEHSNRIEEYRSLIADKSRSIEEEKERNRALKDTIEGQAQKIEGLREYFEHKLEKAEGQESEYAQALRENYATELDAKLEAATTELKEMLQMREVELMYRNEQESQLRDEVARLRKDNQGLVGSSHDELLSKMVSQGVSFVTYQPGAGHITIPLSDIADYMANPVAYAAGQCGVQEAHYKAWLEHYQAPVCTALGSDGGICGENVSRVSNPADFHSGDQDRCKEHKEIKGAKSLKVVSG